MAFAGKDCGPDKHTGFTYKGREIILSKTRGRPMHPHWKKGYYTDKERIEAVALYAATGSYPRVAELTGIGVGSLRKWSKEDWFGALLDEIRAENDQAIDAKFNNIIGTALDKLADRVENGDFVLTKDGELVRKPVGARDLSIVTAINIDKRQLLRGKPTSRTESIANQSVEQRLLTLANEFKKLTGRKPKPPEIIDVVPITEEENHATEQSTEGSNDLHPGQRAQDHGVSEGESPEARPETVQPDGTEGHWSELRTMAPRA